MTEREHFAKMSEIALLNAKIREMEKVIFDNAHPRHYSEIEETLDDYRETRRLRSHLVTEIEL